jgi:peptidyl-prolyl cis-trans isomerase C
MKIKHIVLGLTAVLAVAGCQQEEASDQAAEQASGEAVAYVNDQPISRQMFEFHLERRTGGQPQLTGAEDREALLKELVDMTLLAQEAERKGLDDSEDVAARLQSLRSAVLAQAAVEEMARQAPDDAAIQAAYEKRFAGEQGQEYRARHILVEDKQQAEQVIAQLNEGAEFAKLAEERSTGPSGPKGGDLGWFQPEQMVPPFAEAVEKMEPGSYTKEPVQTQFGWHVIKLEETRPIEPPPIEEVREQLAALLTQERVESHLEELRKQADIRMELPQQGTEAPAEQQPAEQPQEQQQPQDQSQEPARQGGAKTAD